MRSVPYLLFWSRRRAGERDGRGPRAAHRQPGAEPHRAGVRPRPRRPARRPHRLLHPPARRVARVAKVGGTKDVNLAKLRRLAPTHVLVNVDENRRETVAAIEAWGAAAPEIVVTHPIEPDDNLALIDQFAASSPARPGWSERAAALRDEVAAELAATAPAGRQPQSRPLPDLERTLDDGRRATLISRACWRPVGWQTLPALAGGRSGAGRYPVLRGDEPWLARGRPRPAQLRAVRLRRAACLPRRRRSVRRPRGAAGRRRAALWYGARAAAGLRYLRSLADDNGAPPGAAS